MLVEKIYSELEKEWVEECELNSIPEAWLFVLVEGDLEEFVNCWKDF